MSAEQGLHRELTAKLVDAAVEVHRVLGPGYLESFYEQAFARELELRGIKYERQKTFRVQYKDVEVGEHRLDFLVEDVVIVELKAIKELTDADLARMISYLKATNLEVGLFFNFAKARMKDGIRRVARTDALVPRPAISTFIFVAMLFMNSLYLLIRG